MAKNDKKRVNYGSREDDFFEFFLEFTKVAIERAREKEEEMRSQDIPYRRIRECSSFDFLEGMNFFYSVCVKMREEDCFLDINFIHTVEEEQDNETDD